MHYLYVFSLDPVIYGEPWLVSNQWSFLERIVNVFVSVPLKG